MKNYELKLIYEKYYKALFLYALSLTKNKQDAEDLVQSTFLKALLSYQNTGSIRYWLTKVLRNEFLNQCQNKKRIVDEGSIDLDILESDMCVLNEIIQNEEKRILLYTIMQLPILQKEILIESIYFNLTDEEISSSHNISKENVRQIRSRGKRKVIEILKEDTL